ncbi:uncharacterized protein YjlB [Burkholderia sp. OAS925]|uniref:cupin domain-containing protein n=1 Tax=Paraburkholderia graminis TaxID=60548 RepID=UPI003475EEFE
MDRNPHGSSHINSPEGSHQDSIHAFDAAQTEYEAFMLEPHDWVPNNRKLPVVIYRQAVDPAIGDLAAAFEVLFGRNEWPPQWRDGIFDYHHFHSTAHEVLGVSEGSAEVIVGGPGGKVVSISAGDVLLLPAGTGHCLQSFEGHFRVVAGYPAGQQWDIRRDALTPQELAAMHALPFPPMDPVDGKHGPLCEHWLGAAECR